MMNLVPVSAAVSDYFNTSAKTVETASAPYKLRLSVDARITDFNSTELARIVQNGFSEIAICSGGEVFEY